MVSSVAVGSFAITCCSVFYHHGVRSSVTCRYVLDRSILNMMFAVYAGMLKTGVCVWPWKTRISNNAENVKLMRAHPQVWQISHHTWVVAAAVRRSPGHTGVRSESLYMWTDVQCVFNRWQNCVCAIIVCVLLWFCCLSCDIIRKKQHFRRTFGWCRTLTSCSDLLPELFAATVRSPKAFLISTCAGGRAACFRHVAETRKLLGRSRWLGRSREEPFPAKLWAGVIASAAATSCIVPVLNEG